MLQRLQSVFLGLVGLSLVVGLSTPLWEKVRPGNASASLTLTAFSLVYTQGEHSVEPTLPYPVWLLSLLWIASLGLTFYIITRYRARAQQIQLCGLNILLMAAALLLVFYFSQQAEGFLAPDRKGHYLVGTYALLFALLFNWLARFFIQRDEKLARSANSLR